MGKFLLAVAVLLVLQIITADMGIGLTLVVYVFTVAAVVLVLGILRIVLPSDRDKAQKGRCPNQKTWLGHRLVFCRGGEAYSAAFSASSASC